MVFFMPELLNIEIKARTEKPEFMQRCMKEWGADYRGLDKQTDTYFNIPNGRLKLRSGNIENNLIYYQRANHAGPKGSHFHLSPVTDSRSMLDLLTATLGVKVEVRKQRHIWFIENVKFHLDEVGGLGHFVEIEASNRFADLSAADLEKQCRHYMNALNIKEEDLIDRSYSDMLSEE